MSKTVLIISYSNLNTDPRVLRQIDALGDKYTIITAGLTASKSASVASHVALRKFDDFHVHYNSFLKKLITLFYIKARSFLFLRAFKIYNRYYWDRFRWEALKKLSSFDFDMIIANDAEALPLAVALKGKKACKILFDAHEYSPLEFEENVKWKKVFSPYFIWLCEKYIKETDYCTTVSHGLAKAYEKLTGKKFSLIYNAPEYAALVPKEPAAAIKFVHHGAAIPARNIELMIQAFTRLPQEFELHLILVRNSPTYYQELYTIAKPYRNIFFHDPVPTKQIPAFLNQFDVGIFMLPPINFNYKFALPNKFFEFVQARLMIFIGPSPEMKYFVDSYHLGVVTDDFEIDNILKEIRKLDTKAVFNYKLQAGKVAFDLSGAKSMENIRTIVADLTL